MKNDRKVILVTRRTRMDELIAQYNTEAQAEFVINSRGISSEENAFEEYRLEHQRFVQSLAHVEATLKSVARVQVLDRQYLANFVFGPDDIIVVVGQDGLVANTLKYLHGQPVIAINPEPSRYDGILLPFKVKETRTVINDVIRGQFSNKRITMAKATLNDGQELLAVNDLFIGPRLQTSARYEITLGNQTELQSSSGIIVSTGLGSSGWMKSVLTGATGIIATTEMMSVVRSEDFSSSARSPRAQNRSLHVVNEDLSTETTPQLEKKTTYSNTHPWDSEYLTFAVREPFPSQVTGTAIIFGQVDRQHPLTVASRMPNNGVIFSDGMVDDIVEFNSGAVAGLGVAKQQGILVV